MIFHENRLLVYFLMNIILYFFFQKLGKMSQNLSSAAVVICALREIRLGHWDFNKLACHGNNCSWKNRYVFSACLLSASLPNILICNENSCIKIGI